MRTKLLMIIIIVFTFLSCTKSGNPVVSDYDKPSGLEPDNQMNNEIGELSRDLSEFAAYTTVFPEQGQEGIFYDADITEVLKGPDNGDPGVLALDNQLRSWSVAVALEETGTLLNPTRTICYRFLGPGPDFMSPVFGLPQYEGNIRFARVASCLIDGDEHPNDTFVEVAIAYQVWNGGEWEIHVVRIGYDPDVFNNLNWGGAIIEWGPTPFDFNYPNDDYDEIMPDIEYDPVTGDLYVVMTRYENESLPRIWMRPAVRNHQTYHSEVTWHPKRRVQFTMVEDTSYPYDLPEPMHGFHPRIDIGYVTLFPFPEMEPDPDWYIMIVYTGDYGIFTPFLSYWLVGEWPSEFNYNELDMNPGSTKAGFMPVIDIGLPDTDHCAMAWSQTRSESWNDVTVGFVDLHYGYGFLETDTGLVSSAFPSVSVIDREIDDTFETSLFFMESDNPNSINWRPSYRNVVTDWLNVPPVALNLGTETSLNETFFGDYDSGSQFSNWYGMSSSIAYSVINPNNCWVIWSSHTEAEQDWNHLTTVYGAYGNTFE